VLYLASKTGSVIKCKDDVDGEFVDGNKEVETGKKAVLSLMSYRELEMRV